MSEPRRVVVIGAGPAGLAAAFEHARRGERVVVLERAERCGGRAAPSASGEDPWSARVTTADHALLGLVRACGAADTLLPIRPVPGAQVANGRVETIPPGADPRHLARLPGVSWIAALRTARLARLLARYRAHLDPSAPGRAAPLDDRSLADFATLYFGRGAVTGWLEPWLAERAPVDEREASRVAFLLRWSAERAAVAGSFGAPLARLLAALAAPLEVRLGAAVERVEPLGPGRLRVATAGESFEADLVVMAIPAPAALAVSAPVLVAAERAILAGVRYDAAIAWRARAAKGARPLRLRIAPRGRSPLASIAVEDGSLVAIARDPWASAQLDVADDALAKELADAVERVLPGVATDAGRLLRFPLAWPRFDVGHYRAIARLRSVEADRRAAGRPHQWAGDWLAAPTLDGAVVSAASPR